METKKSESGELECSRCGFKNADCLEYVDCELLCQNCKAIKLGDKLRDSENLGDLIQAKIDSADDDMEEEYGSLMKAPKGFTLEVTNEDILMPKLN